MSEQELLKQIEKNRQKVIAVASQYGLTNEKTVKYSQELDLLINQYQRLHKEAYLTAKN
ncbi:aspartyl-phosphate phosphatase Spo0E family protein [Pseudalkalibacillus caeni]|uniref:Aspartyl-phosphate phosphatase Spo0E family protein n=1 Tax=Exobacillus caeni TaxID=2574798 RepID=A0A5R9F3J4_9BACL|nr:aspartyl-phosphate phosphatase Spo0E family protein [Pseudalkalibacillus caeni]TLS36158.1 aspartyl-phosphate phosphatase Spo0E family protein [Pseudalkalibacillus caeni]